MCKPFPTPRKHSESMFSVSCYFIDDFSYFIYHFIFMRENLPLFYYHASVAWGNEYSIVI